MATGFGVRDLAQSGRVVPASADGLPRYKPGGVTLDWATVPAAGSPMTLSDGTPIKTGERFIRYGTVVSLISAMAAYSLAITATGGNQTFTVSVNGGAPQTTAPVAFNASAGATQAALEALSNVAPGDVTVAGTGPLTFAFGGALAYADVQLTRNAAGLTGGSSTLTPTGQGSLHPNYFGPYAAGALDGRQNLNRGDCFITNFTVVEREIKSLYGGAAGFFDGGLVFLLRVLNNGTDLTTNPTRSQLETAFPDVAWAKD